MALAGGVNAAACPDLKDAKAFFEAARGKVHKKSLSSDQVASYACLIAYWNQLKLSDKRWLAYAMGTGWHEAYMRPIREGSGSHQKAIAAAKFAYTKGWTKRAYHLPDPITGKIYYGRGLVQLTWAENYRAMGEVLGMGDKLWREPDLVMEPEIAAKVMLQGMLLGKFRVENSSAIIKKCTGASSKTVRSRLGVYFNKDCAEWYRARQMINGDLAKTANKIAGYAKNYLSGLGTVPVAVAAGKGDVIETEELKPGEELPLPEEPEIYPEPFPDQPGGAPVDGTDTAGIPPAGGTQTEINPIPDAEIKPEAEPKPEVPTGELVPVEEKEITPELQPDIPLDTPVDVAGGGAPTPDATPTPGGMTGMETPVSQPETPAGTGGGTAVADAGGGATGGAGTGTPAGGDATGGGTTVADTPATPPAPAVDTAAVAKVEAIVAEQTAQIVALKGSLEAQKADIEEARAAGNGARQVAEQNRNTLDQMNARLQQIADTLASLTQDVAALKQGGGPKGTDPSSSGDSKPPAGGGKAETPVAQPEPEPAPAPETSPAPAGKPAAPQGWFDQTLSTIKDYVWKSR